MAGWLDDFLKAQATGEPSAGTGLLAMLGLGPPQGWEPGWQGPKMPVPGSPGMTIPEVQGPPMPPNPAAATPAAPAPVTSLPEQYAIPPQFQGGVPYFAPDVRGADIPGAVEPPRSAVAPIAAPAAAPDILGTIGRHIMQGLRDNSNSLIAGGGAMISGGLGHGLSAMAQASPLDLAARRERQGNQAIAATYQAVLQQQISRGVPAPEARANALAASQNPEILKTFMGPQFQHVEIKGIGGDTQVGAFDPRTGTVTVGGKPVGASGGTSGEVPSGQEYLDKYVPKELHNSVRAMANYDLPTGGFGALKQLQPHVANYDPTFDAASYPTKVALKKAYQGGGKNFQELQALETVSHHMGKLMESAKALDPSDWKVINNIRNIMSDNPIIGRDNPALVRFRNDLNTVQHELGNAYHAGHITDTSLKAFQQAIADNMSTPGLKAAIGEMGGLLEGKIRANANSYTSNFPGKALPGEFKGLSDKAAEAFTRINDWANNIPQSTPASQAPRMPQEGDTASGPGGVRVILRGNKWVPVQ